MGVIYWLGAFALLLVGVLLLVRRGQNEPARNTALAAMVSAGWAILMVYQSPAGTWPTWNAMMAGGFRFGKSLLQPGDICRLPLQMLGVHVRGAAEIVVLADDVHGDEGDASHRPAQVLAEF